MTMSQCRRGYHQKTEFFSVLYFAPSRTIVSFVPYHHERMRVRCAFAWLLACLHSWIHVSPFLCHNICWHFLFGYNFVSRAHTISEGFFSVATNNSNVFVWLHVYTYIWMSVAEALFHFVPFDVCYYHYSDSFCIYLFCCCLFVSYEKKSSKICVHIALASSFWLYKQRFHKAAAAKNEQKMLICVCASCAHLPFDW